MKAVDRNARGARWGEALALDARFSVRLLWKERWFSLAAITALALGLGVSTMAVTIINGFYYRGLPIPESERILYLGVTDSTGEQLGLSYQDYRDWRESNRSFAELAAFFPAEMTFGRTGETPDSRPGAYVSATAFSILGEKPALGRGLSPADDLPGAPPVVLLGHRLWSSRFGSDPNIIGRSVSVNRTPATVIGVMGPRFEFPFREGLWQPLALLRGIETQGRDVRTLSVFGRLADDVTPAQARAALATIAARLAEDHPDTNSGIRPRAVPFAEGQVGRFANDEPPQLFAVIAVIVLALACANVSNLLLARSTTRAREIAIRTSLGATRWRTVRQLMVENLALAIPAAAVGLWLSRFGVRFVADSLGQNVPYWMEFAVDGRVLLLLAASCLLATVLFGLVPALSVSQANASDVMREGGRTGVAPRARRWTDALLVAEVALTLILLAGAGLMVRSFLALYRADLVVDASGRLTAQLSWPDDKRPSAEERSSFYQRLDDRLAGVPGIQLATIASKRPFVGATASRLSLGPESIVDPARLPSVSTIAVGPRYFDTLGVRLLRGRAFTSRDRLPGAPAAIVNQLFAETYYPNDEVVGRRIQLLDNDAESGAESSFTVVGISPTVRHRIASQARPVVYVPLASYKGSDAALIVGDVLDPSTAESLLREEIASIDAEVNMFNVRPLEDLLADSRLQPRLMGMLSPVFAGIALILSMVGLYAVTAYAVLQRTHEIGVRMTLGAQRRQVVWLFARKRLIPLASGLLIGLTGAFGLSRVLQRLLVLTRPTDPLSLMVLAIVGALVLVVLAASVFPAWRAARLDPSVVLRSE